MDLDEGEASHVPSPGMEEETFKKKLFLLARWRKKTRKQAGQQLEESSSLPHNS